MNPQTSTRTQPTTLNEQVALRIQQMIVEEKYEPGAQLPSERELAKLFGINRTTVGEAISQLESFGLVKKMVGRGTFVIDMPRSIVSEAIERFYVFGTCSPAELLEFREMMEPIVARLAAEHATPDQLARLAEYVEVWERTFPDEGIENNVEADVLFHQALAQATNNSLIIAFFEGIQNIFHDLLKQQRQSWLATHRENDTRPQWRDIHRKIYEAVARGDRAMAERTMSDHMRFARGSMWNGILTEDRSQATNGRHDSERVAKPDRVALAGAVGEDFRPTEN